MRSTYFPIVLTILGSTLYHLSQKSIPKTANPLIALIIAYIVGILLCAFFTIYYPSDKSLLNTIKDMNWAVITVGIGAAMIEIGFLLAYRAGWNISITGTLIGAAVTLILVPIGMIVFKERLSLWNLLGIVCCILGLFLVSRR